MDLNYSKNSALFTLYTANIFGMWGRKNVKLKFNDDLTILIGSNGSGKTTVLRLIEGALAINIELLSKYQFDIIRLKMKHKRRRVTIEVKKEYEEIDYANITFTISERNNMKKYTVPAVDRFSKHYRSGRLHPKAMREIHEVRHQLSMLYNVSYLAVNREMSDDDQDEINFREKRTKLNTVEGRLNRQMNSLTSYRLSLEQEITKLAKKFERDVLESILYDKKVDRLSFEVDDTVSEEELTNGLLEAYSNLGALDVKVRNRIKTHSKALVKSVETVAAWQNDRSATKSFQVNDMLPLILLKRTQQILNLADRLERDKGLIYNSLLNYINILKEFMENKSFEASTGGLSIKSEDGPIKLEDLSSGEKQIVILMTELLLQNKIQHIFIADEPELSLHIKWQRNIIRSMKKLNPNAQIVLATHSPEVVGAYRDNVAIIH